MGLGAACLSGVSAHCVCLDPRTWPQQIATAAYREIIFYLIPAFIAALVIRNASQVYLRIPRISGFFFILSF